jgi:hypothetical protein
MSNLEKPAKVQMVLKVGHRTREKLRQMAEDDRRAVSAQLEHLVELESARRLKALTD